MYCLTPLTSEVRPEAVVIVLEEGVQQLGHVVGNLVGQPRLLLHQETSLYKNRQLCRLCTLGSLFLIEKILRATIKTGENL
jgi:hypothetical protein